MNREHELSREKRGCGKLKLAPFHNRQDRLGLRQVAPDHVLVDLGNSRQSTVIAIEDKGEPVLNPKSLERFQPVRPADQYRGWSAVSVLSVAFGHVRFGSSLVVRSSVDGGACAEAVDTRAPGACQEDMARASAVAAPEATRADRGAVEHVAGGVATAVSSKFVPQRAGTASAGSSRPVAVYRARRRGP